MTDSKKSKRGGKRPGAGRPPGSRTRPLAEREVARNRELTCPHCGIPIRISVGVRRERGSG